YRSNRQSDPGKIFLAYLDQLLQRLRDLTGGGRNPEYLRVKIDSGGCHGYQYGFEMTTKKEDDDIIFKVDDVTLLMDSVSYPFLAGAEIDFVDELIGTSFKISKNPNAESECGCKISFQAKI
ncbi:hypothetical protein MP638_005009, partial [Amoeboaphelidium occidentale]